MIFSLPEQNLTDSLYNFSNINAFGTSGIAGETGSTDPDGLGFQEFILEAELSEADDLVGKNVHLRDSRAPRRALAALIAGKQVLAAEFFDLGHKTIPDLSFGYVDSHEDSLFQIRGKFL